VEKLDVTHFFSPNSPLTLFFGEENVVFSSGKVRIVRLQPQRNSRHFVGVVTIKEDCESRVSYFMENQSVWRYHKASGDSDAGAKGQG
jgi:hypothetical protein